LAALSLGRLFRHELRCRGGAILRHLRAAIEAKYYEDTARFLGALMFEFAFSLPDVPQWSLVTGIHHRSGAGGLFSGVRGASNAWVIGIRYSF